MVLFGMGNCDAVEVLAVSDARQVRARRRLMTRAELCQDGPAVRVTDIARATGLSATTLRKAIEAGHLLASRVGFSRRPLWMVERSDAVAYLRSANVPMDVPRDTER